MISVLVLVLVFAIVLYLFNTYVPIAQPMRLVVNAIALGVLLLIVLRMMGILHSPP